MTNTLALYQTLLIISVVGSFIMANYAWVRRSLPAAMPFCMLMICGFIWSFSYLIELSIIDISAKLFFFNTRQIGIVFMPIAWWFFTEEYSQNQKISNFKKVALLSVIPLLTLLFILTSDFHTIIRERTFAVTVNDVTVIQTQRGLWFWVNLIYGYSIVFLGIFVLVSMLRRVASFYRGQIILMIVSFLLPMGMQILESTGNNFFAPFYPAALVFAPSGMLMAWALFRYRLLDFVPIARGLVFENISVGVWVVDDKQRLIDANPYGRELIKQLSRIENPIHYPINQLIPQQTAWQQIYNHPNNSMLEVLLNDTENLRILEIQTTLLTPNQSEFNGHISLIRDVSEQRQNQQKSLELSLERERGRLLQNFVEDASHDLNTPITVIKTSNYVIERAFEKLRQKLNNNITETDVQTISDLIQKMDIHIVASREASQRLQSLVNVLIERARFERDWSMQAQRQNIRPLIENIFENFESLANEKNLTLTLNIQDSLPYVMMDAKAIQKAISALLSNAIQYVPPERWIGLSVESQDDSLKIKVADTGNGIPQEDVPHLFEWFYRVDKARQQKTGGVGLGLAMVRYIVAAHSGQIYVESEVGKGTTFTLILPALH